MEEKPKRSRPRRIVRGFAWALLGTLCAFVALVLVALAILFTTPGQTWLRGFALREVNQSIRGTVALQKLDLRFGGWVQLRDVRLLDPSGKLVARADLVAAKIDPLALLEHRVDLKQVKLEAPQLWIVEDPGGGTNLDAAIAARQPKPKQPKTTSPSPWHFALEDLQLRDGLFDRRTEPSDPNALHVAQITLSGSAADLPGDVRADLKGSAQITSPEQLPVTLAIAAHGTGTTLADTLELDALRLTAGNSSLKAQGGIADSRAQVTAQLELSQALGRALGVPLQSDLPAQLHASWKKGEHAQVALELPHATVHAALAPLAKPLSYDATLALDHFDPHALLTPAPRADLNGELSVKGNGLAPSQIAADLKLALTASSVRDIRVLGLHVSGHLADGVLSFAHLDLELPGAKVAGNGHASMHTLDATLTAQVPQLDAFSKNLGAKPPYQGSASATVHLSGSPRAPAVALQLHAPRLAHPAMDLDLHDVDVQATIPDLRRPTVLHAQLSAARAHLQEEQIEAFRGTVDLNGEAFRANLRSAGPGALTLRADGELPDARKQMALDTLVVGEGSATWTLQSPTALDLAHGVRADHLVLNSGPQRISLTGGLAHRRFSLVAELTAVDLARLPALAVPPRIGLQGIVGGQANVTGTTADPRVQVHLRAQGLAIAQLSAHTTQRLQAQLDGELSHHRASGTLAAEIAGQRAVLDFDTPVALNAPGQVSLRLRADRLELSQLGALAGEPKLLSGRASLDAKVGGTLAKPSTQIALMVHGAAMRDGPAVTGSVKLEAAEVARLGIDLRTGKGTLTGQAELPLPKDLLRHRERLAQLRTTPATVQLGLAGFDLDAWRAEFGIPPDADGTVNATVRAHGTLADPQGTLSLQIHRVVYGRLKGLDAKVAIDAGAAKVAIAAAVQVHGANVLHLDGNLARSLKQLLDAPSRLGAAPVHLTAAVGPLDLADAQGPKPRATGHVDGTVALSGTLDHPELHAHLATRALAFSGAALGELEAAVNYAGERLEVRATLPHFDLRANATAPLGLAALRKGLPLRAIPMDATLVAEKFDLGSLSGISESAHTLGGILDANAQVHGELGDPAFRGRLAVTEGKVVVAGLGDFRHIALALTADNQNVDLEKLELHAGEGWLKLTAKASRADPTAPFWLAGELHAKNFPIDSQDQTLAFVGADAKLDGHLARQSLVNLRFSHLRADVPKLTRKDVQSLAPNPDIVILGRTTKAVKVAKAETPGRARSGTQAPGAAPSEPPWQLQVGIFAPGDVLVRGDDINLDLQAKLGLLIEPGSDPAVQMIPPPGSKQASEVTAVRGWVEVLGRRFEVPNDKPARIEFSGGAPQNASLDVNMVYNDRPDAVVVNVAVTGPLKKPNPPQLTSEPPMDESQLALLIATGHLQAKRGAGTVNAGAEAGSVVGSLLASAIQKTVAKELPIDTVSLQTNAQGQVSAQVGKYITDRIYVGYTRNFGSQMSPGSLQFQDQNTNEVTLQYQLSKHWQLEVVGGEAQGGLDAVWQKDF